MNDATKNAPETSGLTDAERAEIRASFEAVDIPLYGRIFAQLKECD